MQLSINNVSMRFGALILFEDVNATFISGRRYAITGPNGAGKSTLMKVLTGEIEPEKGSVSRPKRMGVLSQDQFAFDAHRVMDTVIMGNRPLWEALQERETLYAKDPGALTDADGMRLGELEGIVGDEGGYTAEVDAAILLDGLDIPEELHDRKMSELQGGQKVRVLLAQALFGNPDVLLLDEPTNNLDLDSVHWLQRSSPRLRRLPDRHFARPPFPERDLHAHRGHRLSNGHHLHGRLRRHGAGENAGSSPHRSRQRPTRKKDRPAAGLHRAFCRRHTIFTGAVAQERSGTPADCGTREVQYPETLHSLRCHKAVREASLRSQRPLEKSYEGATGMVRVFENFAATMSRGEKIALIGRNGAGKTTLLKSLIRKPRVSSTLPTRRFPIDSGSVIWGHEVAVGYFAQDHRESIPHGVTVIEWLHSFDPGASQQELRGLLGQMLFSGDDALKRTEVLSGGEAARIIFCRLMLQKPNFLVLDEPTNHLDLESINALNIALQQFPAHCCW